VFTGTRMARSWYRAGDGTVLHADINGSYNILRKNSSDTRANGARSTGRGSSPQTAGALERMTDRHMGYHFKILFDACCASIGFEAALSSIDTWPADPQPNARRAVSEGLRPWTSKRRAYFAAQPAEAIRRLATLRLDPSDYVRHSAGNALPPTPRWPMRKQPPGTSTIHWRRSPTSAY
jgi:hypothetical protein